jgi:hypothetical protein
MRATAEPMPRITEIIGSVLVIAGYMLAPMATALATTIDITAAAIIRSLVQWSMGRRLTALVGAAGRRWGWNRPWRGRLYASAVAAPGWGWGWSRPWRGPLYASAVAPQTERL